MTPPAKPPRTTGDRPAPAPRAIRRSRALARQATYAPSMLSVIAVAALLASSVALAVPAFAAQPLAEASGKAEKKEMRREAREEWLDQADAAADRLEKAIKQAGRESEDLDARIGKAMEANQALAQKIELAQAQPAQQPAPKPAPAPVARPAEKPAKRAVEECRGRLMVEGEGIETATPDVLQVTFGADARAEQPGQALNDASEATQALLDAVLAAGVEKTDVSTTQVSLNPVYDRSERDRAPEIVAWEAGSSLAVTLHDVSAFGKLATAATEAGATRISGVTFAVSDEDERLEKARAAAVKAALARADLLAEAAGARVGAILELSETGVYRPGPRPMFARAAVGEASMADMPIAEGSQELRASVTATVELCQ
ncbi:SIMPL domain-containing protein [Albimonas sp. CAU 1670]|uniref:SIMPL domain-containing protein n=1 Tax=Albimonas sp. CAU 1670 TaxID=3032599 RepID=UPI0023DAF015|nr:SIMPL domain-containing protein [Albimonas sp. CAU 1670]MDF2233871.1 SIMPL domain-containing protein [Albimonas sp. CAU 1670]